MPFRKGPEGAGLQQAQQKPAVFPGSQEGKPHPGVHQTQHNQPVMRENHPAVFSVGVASP